MRIGALDLYFMASEALPLHSATYSRGFTSDDLAQRLTS
jgi:hypothetical protein